MAALTTPSTPITANYSIPRMAAESPRSLVSGEGHFQPVNGVLNDFVGIRTADRTFAGKCRERRGLRRAIALPEALAVGRIQFGSIPCAHEGEPDRCRLAAGLIDDARILAGLRGGIGK